MPAINKILKPQPKTNKYLSIVKQQPNRKILNCSEADLRQQIGSRQLIKHASMDENAELLMKQKEKALENQLKQSSELPIKESFSFQSQTQQGKMPASMNYQKPNQDCILEFPNLCPNIHFFSVCDGHGVHGHLISQFLRTHLSQNLMEFIKRYSGISEECIKKAFDLTRSTCTGVLIDEINKVFWFVNVGDSRTITIKQTSTQQWHIQQALEDQKPELCEERKRIEGAGGAVQPYIDENGEALGPYRVWIKGQQVPGLAMSRSFGDALAQSVGVNSIPKIKPIQWTSEDKLMVIGSDGVFEFLSNEQVLLFQIKNQKKVMNLVLPYYKNNRLKLACKKIVNESYKLWKEDDEVIDDITCIVICFNQQE